MKNITKKQEKEFNDRVIKTILSVSFQFNPEYGKYEKQTHFGLVRITVPDQKGLQIYSVFSRFDEPEKAMRIFNCNRFTGKYNFHDDNPNTCFDMLDFFLDELETMVEVDKQILADKENNNG